MCLGRGVFACVPVCNLKLILEPGALGASFVGCQEMTNQRALSKSPGNGYRIGNDGQQASPHKLLKNSDHKISLGLGCIVCCRVIPSGSPADGGNA